MESNVAPLQRHATFTTAAGGLAVYPLWMGGVADALTAFKDCKAKLTRALAVAAVLPDQTLELADMDALEEAGLLIVEVPQRVKSLDGLQLAKFVEDQIDGADAAEYVVQDVSRVPSQVSSKAPVETIDAIAHPSDDQEEVALLRSLNDPDADDGGI